MNKKHCVGCANNFFNRDDYECWCFDLKKKLVWRVPVNLCEEPPFKRKKVRVPPCYHERGNSRDLYIDPEDLTKDGYYK